MERKKAIIDELASVVKSAVKENRESEAISSQLTTDVCNVVEAAFIHGLKEQYFHKHTRNDRYPEPLFWTFLARLSHRNLRYQVEGLSLIRNQIGKCRAWVRVVLKEGSLENYLAVVNRDTMLSRRYYHRYALLRDQERLGILMDYATTLCQLPLNVPTNSSILNQWTPTPLILAGVATKAVPHAPASTALDSDLCDEAMSALEFDGLEDQQGVEGSIISAWEEESINAPSSPALTEMSHPVGIFSDHDVGSFCSASVDERSVHDAQFQSVLRTLDKEDLGDSGIQDSDDKWSVASAHGRKETVTVEVLRRGGSGKPPGAGGRLPASPLTHPGGEGEQPEMGKTLISIGTDPVSDLDLPGPSSSSPPQVPVPTVPAPPEPSLLYHNDLGGQRSDLGGQPDLPPPPDGTGEPPTQQSSADLLKVSSVAIEIGSTSDRGDLMECSKSAELDNRPVRSPRSLTSASALRKGGWSTGFISNAPELSMNGGQQRSNFVASPTGQENFQSVLREALSASGGQVTLSSSPIRAVESHLPMRPSEPMPDEIGQMIYASEFPPFVEVKTSEYVILESEDIPEDPVQKTAESMKSRVSLLSQVSPETGLDAQDFKCAACAKMIGLMYSDWRPCSLDGNYYCRDCFGTHTAPIPGRIVQNWDLRPRPISRPSRAYLDLIHEEPVIEIEKANPAVYDNVPEMALILKHRRQLSYVAMYLITCSDGVAADLRKRIWPRDYLFESVHLYSVSDLMEVVSGSLLKRLKSLIDFSVKHVKGCPTCSAKGFFCELCRNGEVIYPFDVEKTTRCTKCYSTYHSECYECQTRSTCPKCERREAQAKATGSPVFSFGEDFALHAHLVA